MTISPFARHAARAVVLAFSLAVSAARVHAQDGLKIGATVPVGLPLETLDGQKVDLGRYIGGVPVVVEFWAAWCGNCRQLAPQLAAAAKRHGDKLRIVTIAVSFNETVDVVKKHLATHPLAGEVFYDRTGETSEKFDAPGTSYIVILDKAGKVVYTGMGASQQLDAAIRKAM